MSLSRLRTFWSMPFKPWQSAMRKRKPLFLFPHVSEPRAVATGSKSSTGSRDPVATARGSDTNEIDWKAQSVMRYHGRLPDLARDVIQRRANHQATTMFVMPSRGVAERVTEILRDYEVNARLASFDDASDPASFDAVVTFGRLSGGFELPSARLIVH